MHVFVLFYVLVMESINLMADVILSLIHFHFSKRIEKLRKCLFFFVFFRG